MEVRKKEWRVSARLGWTAGMGLAAGPMAGEAVVAQAVQVEEE